MTNEPLVDGFNRRMEYLRVSITDRCNLKCAYCAPSVTSSSRASSCDMLQDDDFLRLINVFACLGIRKVRLTGGEPLARRGAVGLIERIGRIPGVMEMALTTNGTGLKPVAEELARAGVARVNISLDTLSRHKYRKITGRDGFNRALEGFHAALSAGFSTVKVNTVVMAGVNDDEVEEFARLSIGMKAQFRFIEFMPTSAGLWSKEKFVPMSEVKRLVEKLGPLIPASRRQWGGPAEVYRLANAQGEVGFISAVSRHFCADCNRLRITSSGKLMTCLFGGEDLDLREMMRSGSTDAQIAEAIRHAVINKNAVRSLPEENETRLAMACVGG
ncbi:MAG: GTP 3',8-cyclase MoaA [Nitrospinae bacterium]|nr:GTP 3',8-cyclase MoaA [Nitrospinota bacterium]